VYAHEPPTGAARGSFGSSRRRLLAARRFDVTLQRVIRAATTVM